MIEKTEAIALRITPYSKTSQVISWLTPASGRLVTLAKGACRPKSHFLGQYDIFYTCEILYYHREHRAIHILKECSPNEVRSFFRDDWKAMMCASYMCDLVLRVSPEHHSQPELYNLLVSALDPLGRGAAGPQLLIWFELKLMQLQGMSPRLLKCQACRTGLETGVASHVEFSSASGGILCPSCARKRGESGLPITPDVLAMLRNWQSSESPIAAGRTRINGKQLVALRKILGTFLAYHLDFVPLSRSIVMDTFQETARSKADRTVGKK